VPASCYAGKVKKFSLAEYKWHILLGLTVVAIVLGVWARAYNLGYPNKQVFDEVYFPVFANNYLHRIPVFDVHPPLGKFFIAVGIALFGNIPFGWRILPLLFGIANIWLMAAIWWALFKDKVGAAIMAFLIAIDGIFIIYSRTGLMDGILFFFIFFSFYLMVKLKPTTPIIWVATVLGLTASMKWVGLAILVPVAYLSLRRKRWGEFLFCLPWAAFVYMAVVVAGEVLNGSADPITTGWLWNAQAWNYHVNLTATHPYSSPWWSWPFLEKPVLFLYDVRPDGLVNAMTTRGNTFVWWASSLIVLMSLGYILVRKFREKQAVADHPLTLFLIGYAACLLPFIPIHRILFIYHYIPAYGFALLMLTYWLVEAWKKYWWFVIIFLLIAFVVSILFFPLAVGWWPISQKWALMSV